MKNRYIFFKKLFPETVILIKKKNKYVTYGLDKYLKKYLSKDINYIIVDKNNKIRKYNYKNNKYKKYMYKVVLEEIISKVNG